MNEQKVILVAEGNRKISRLISFFLLREGYKVKQVYSGITARRALEQHTFAAAVIEIMLPIVDGIQILKKIRAADPRLPVIMLSVKSRVDDKQESLALGANDYITKPFELSNLIGRLQKAMGEQQ